jgi:hypothetical protein
LTGVLYRLLYGGRCCTGESGQRHPVPSDAMTPVREQDADTVAIDIYRRVDKTGERITLGLVDGLVSA